VHIFAVGLSLILAGLFLAASRLLLPACGIDIGALGFLRHCPVALAATPPDDLADLALRRTELERQILTLQGDLATRQCPVPQPEPVGDVDERAWNDGDLGLLEGCWLMDHIYRTQDIVTREITEYDEYSICFGPAGDGVQTIRATDGTTCGSSLQASFGDDGVLQMQDPANVPCSDGAAIYRRDFSCQLTTQQTINCTNFVRETGDRAGPYRMRRN